MTRENFTEEIKILFTYNGANDQFRFICFDEYQTRIGFNPIIEDQFEEYIINYKFLDKIVKLTNNKNIKILYNKLFDGECYCELIIDGFTIENNV